MVANLKSSVHVLQTSPAAAGGAPAGEHWLARLRRVFQRQRQRARLRRELPHLDERLLHDANLRRQDLRAEAAKPFWRA